MRHGISELIAICTLALVGLFGRTAEAAPPIIHEESFEGCTGTGYSLSSGSFGGDASDGIECGPPFTFSLQAGAPVTGFHGSNYIYLEDVDDVLIPNPNAVVLAPISIANTTNLGISFLFAAPNATNTRYETSDFLQVQYRIDAGPWVTVGSFQGTGAIGMAEDDNLDGTFTVPVNGLAMQRFSYTLNNRAGAGTVSGSSMDVRIYFSSEGSQEEMVFDDIIISGDVAAVPVIDFAASSYSYNEDGTAVGSQVTLTRSGGTSGTASVNVTFTSGTAVAPGDFTSTTTSVSFTAGQTSKTVTLPIIDDDIDENSESFSLGLAADGSGAVVGTTITSSTITIVDDDTADITVSESAVSIAESGTTDTFTVVLESEPTASVLVDVSVASGQALVASGGSGAASVTLTFTSANWDTPQTVTVSAVNDTVVEANPHSDSISLTVDSTDLKYDGFALTDITVSVAENDNCGDLFCNPSESTVSCPADCGTSCGDTACNGSESTANCAIDCGSLCGDTACNGSETTANCVADCGSSCGDTVCNGSETTANCVSDCGSSCGDTVCNGSETTANCFLDCGSSCGDGTVNGAEVCDGVNLMGQTCVSQGFDYGLLLCASNCNSFDTAGCDYEMGSDAGPDGGLVEAGVDTGTEEASVTSDIPATSDLTAATDVTSTDDLTITSEATEASSETSEVVTVELTSSAPVASTDVTPGGVTSDDDISTTPDATSTVVTTTGGGTSEPVVTSETPASTSSEPVVSVPGSTSAALPTSEPAPSTMVETSAPIATIDVTSESTPVGGTSGPTGTASGETDTVVSTDIVETSAPVIIPGETDDDVSTAQPDDTTAGNVGPGVVVDAGPDAGVDAGGFIDDTNDDGCDCRVGARPRSNAASLLALGLLGLVFVRIRQRRKS